MISLTKNSKSRSPEGIPGKDSKRKSKGLGEKGDFGVETRERTIRLLAV